LSFDNVCKFLAESYPEQFARWLLSGNISNIQVLKTELSIEPIRADSITLLRTINEILQLEFQTLPQSNPPVPFRMLKYWTRLYDEYNSEIEQVVLFLKRTNSPDVLIDSFQSRNTIHRYRVIRMWEQDPAPLLANPALLPLATLAQSDSPNILLEQVAQEVARIESTQERANVAACVSVLAGLRFDNNVITQLFKEEIMQESVFYQSIIEKGEQRGRQEGRKQGEEALLLRLLTRRIGRITPEIQARIQQLTISQLEDLGEALLDFSQPTDLTAWLESHQA